MLAKRHTLFLFALLCTARFAHAAASNETRNNTLSPVHFPLNDSSLLPANVSKENGGLPTSSITETNSTAIINNLNTPDPKRAKRVPPGFDPSTLLKREDTQVEANSTLENSGTNSTVESQEPLEENTTVVLDTPAEDDANNTISIDLLQDLRIELIVSRGAIEEPLVEGEIFRDGKLSKFFRTCATEEEALNSEQIYPLSKRECFRDSEYTDRIEFRFYYDPTLLADGRSVTANSQISRMEDTVASSYISNENVRTLTETEPSGTTRIYYGCLENATETLSLIFTVSNATNTENIKMTWEKYCRTGIPRHIQMKSDSTSKETVFWPPEVAMQDIAVSPSQMSTSLDIALDRKYLQQYFIGPFVNQSDTSVVKATLRGTESKGGILHSDSSVHFNIMYACKGTGVSEISFTMAVPPFSNVTASWMKECGGKIPPNLAVGTKTKGNDVVKAGVVQDPYKMLDSQLGMPHSELHKHLETNLTMWKLYISTTSEEESSIRSSFGLHMGHPVITIENPSVVYASTSKVTKVSRRGRSGYNYNDQSVILRDDEELEVSFSLVCLRIGESRVFISLPMLHYDAVEFGFAKLCESVPKKKTSMALTVKTFFAALGSFVILAVGVFSYYTYKRWKNSVHYEGLTTLEA